MNNTGGNGSATNAAIGISYEVLAASEGGIESMERTSKTRELPFAHKSALFDQFDKLFRRLPPRFQ